MNSHADVPELGQQNNELKVLWIILLRTYFIFIQRSFYMEILVL